MAISASRNAVTRQERVRIGHVDVDALEQAELMDRLDAMVQSGDGHFVCFCESNLCVHASLDASVREALQRASLVLPDGVGMTAGARLFGERLPSRLPGPSVMLDYLRHSAHSGRRHFFYGGSTGVAEELADRLSRQIPGLQVVGTFSPPFRTLSPGELQDVKNRIESAGTEVLWVALGAPKQEKWMAENVHRIRVPLMLGVGAAFDFHTGRQKWAPRWIRKAGMEWLYRALTGGRRLLARNARCELKFTSLIARQVLTPTRGQSRAA